MQVQHDARAGCARGRQRAPAERGIEVVRVNDARAAQSDCLRHFVRRHAAAQQAECRVCTPESRGVPLQQLDRLAQVLAHEPHQLLHRALLASRRAVPVV